jgi:rhodanese-related sulfurtransferase
MKTHITVQQLNELQQRGESIQLIDVRSADEFNSGHVPHAVNIPLEQLNARLPDLSQHRVALLCKSGRRAEMACDQIPNDDRKLLVVDGGTTAWVAAGLPVVQTTRSSWSLERQVRLIAGLLVLLGTLLSIFVHPGWIGLAIFVGAGLTFAGATDLCLMGSLLAKMPWNQPSFPRAESQS